VHLGDNRLAGLGDGVEDAEVEQRDGEHREQVTYDNRLDVQVGSKHLCLVKQIDNARHEMSE